MISSYQNRFFVSLALILLAVAGNETLAQQAVPPPPAVGSPGIAPQTGQASGEEVMTRGPIHEAFAEPVNTGAVQPLIVPKQPPEPINEAPSDTRPADENATWISGYWTWDDERNDFVWASGVWRVPPPGRRWIPGYWAQVDNGFQWVPGVWASAASEDVTYYPPPPETKDEAPTGEPPSADTFWIPGYWNWSGTSYAWQPGRWSPAYAGWTWIPASYTWCPRGWLFRDGYWDFPLAQRGLIFAPVRFAGGIFGRPGFSYRPSVAIDPSLLTFYLFVRPTYSHYYFGDYFGAQYDRLAIYPWFSVFRQGRYAYDPLFSYYGWYYRGRDPRWAQNLQTWHAYYRAHPDVRPPHDLASQRAMLARGGQRQDREFLAIAHPVQEWRGAANAPVRLTSVSSIERSRIEQAIQQTRQFQTERARWETRTATGQVSDRRKNPLEAAKLAGPEKFRLPAVSGVRPGEPISPRVANRPETFRSETLRNDRNPGGAVPRSGATPGGPQLPQNTVPPQQQTPRIPGGQSLVPPTPGASRPMPVPRESFKPVVPNPAPRSGEGKNTPNVRSKDPPQPARIEKNSPRTERPLPGPPERSAPPSKAPEPSRDRPAGSKR